MPVLSGPLRVKIKLFEGDWRPNNSRAIARRFADGSKESFKNPDERGKNLERLAKANSRAHAATVKPVGTLKPGSPLQRVHPVSVDRAREHADPPYMDKAPV